jgi:uncharacterized protein
VLDLRRLRLRPGEVRRERLDVPLEPFELGGQVYAADSPTTPVAIDVAQPSGAMILDLRAGARLAGPCMRCLEDAAVEIDVTAREFHDPDAPKGDELRSEYVVDDQLQVGAWLRDAVALGIPDQILCRPDCAGLCFVCGKDLNVEPHVHEDTEPDPRWAALAELRDSSAEPEPAEAGPGSRDP